MTPGSRLTLRKTEGIRAWHDALRRLLGRHRLDRMDRRAMETSEQFWERTIREEPQPSNRESLGQLHSHLCAYCTGMVLSVL